MLVKNCHPNSLLPIFGKMFERLKYTSLFNCFGSNRLFTPFQSGLYQKALIKFGMMKSY